MSAAEINIIHHYPPELMALLVDAIPRLLRSKKDVLGFFKGAGVADAEFADIAKQLRQDRNAISKFDIVRTILTRLNDRGEASLRERREVLKRVVEWDNFSNCWENDQMAAKGYVAEIAKLVNVKDSFTRMNQEREKAQSVSRTSRDAELADKIKQKAEREKIRADLYGLFALADASKRGTLLEGILNRLFASHGILIREAFRVVGRQGEGVIEQIDGVIEFDGHVYLVEMKWWTEALGPGQVSPHLVRVISRSDARGLVISSSGYTDAGVSTCREFLHHRVAILAKLEEIVFLLERDGSLVELLRNKVRAAITNKEPLVEPLKEAARG